MPEAIFNFEDGSVVEIEKVGGGTIGKKYGEGEHWFFRLTRTDKSVEEGLSFPSTTLMSGVPMTHENAANLVHDLFA
jgi:hypothetical protein